MILQLERTDHNLVCNQNLLSVIVEIFSEWCTYTACACMLCLQCQSANHIYIWPNIDDYMKYTPINSMLNWHYAEPSSGPPEVPSPPEATPTQPNNSTIIGVSVALAVLLLSAVGACVPVIACIYFRSRHSRKQITERYGLCITFCIQS